MQKHDKSLFQIGEVTKILGVTRKALLVYENMGLLKPAIKDESSGYRYYSADNMTQIRSIRSLQSLGLTLREVAKYYYNTENIDSLLQRLIELRIDLDNNIKLLQMRSAKRGDFTVHKTTLPRHVCFTKRYECDSVEDVAIKLRDTYIAAARTGKMSNANRMFTMRMSSPMEKLDIMCCIPIEESYYGEERTEFAETKALCVYHRGPYEELPLAVKALNEYTKENNIQINGNFRSIYLEGPPNRGEKKEDYITQIAVPIKE